MYKAWSERNVIHSLSRFPPHAFIHSLSPPRAFKSFPIPIPTPRFHSFPIPIPTPRFPFIHSLVLLLLQLLLFQSLQLPLLLLLLPLLLLPLLAIGMEGWAIHIVGADAECLPQPVVLLLVGSSQRMRLCHTRGRTTDTKDNQRIDRTFGEGSLTICIDWNLES